MRFKRPVQHHATRQGAYVIHTDDDARKLLRGTRHSRFEFQKILFVRPTVVSPPNVPEKPDQCGPPFERFREDLTDRRQHVRCVRLPWNDEQSALTLPIRTVVSALGEGLTDTSIPFCVTEDHAELSPIEAHFQKTNRLAKFPRRLPEIRDVVANGDGLVPQAERDPVGRDHWRSSRVSGWLVRLREAHKHSLTFLRPKDYRGLGDKIVFVSVKPLTQG